MEWLQETYLTYQSTIAYIGINALLALSVYVTLSGGSYRDAVSFAALFLILVLRPRGLFGAPSLREA